ncbi:hypothetical protein FRC17_006948 [Serendipita sp. 399]|nr:hypothetical protein FRC17_006948 [Serendipita sp. 399]
MVVIFVCWTVTTALWANDQNRPAANATIALMPIYFLAYSIAYTPMLISYTVEILPYTIRAKGFSMMHMTVGIGITTNQFVNPIAFKALKWKLYIVYCCWLVFELIYVFLYLVETKGKTLEETAALFDGKEVVQNIENVGNEAAHQSRHRYRMNLGWSSTGGDDDDDDRSEGNSRSGGKKFEKKGGEIALSRRDSNRSIAANTLDYDHERGVIGALVGGGASDKLGLSTRKRKSDGNAGDSRLSDEGSNIIKQ